MALISIAGQSYVFNPIIKKKENVMKEYEVTLKQTVEGTLVLKADNKTEAKEIVKELVDDNKIQHLIKDVEDLECDGWEIQSVEDY